MFVKVGSGDVVQVLIGPWSTVSLALGKTSAWLKTANDEMMIHIKGMKSEKCILWVGSQSLLSKLSVSTMETFAGLDVLNWERPAKGHLKP